MMNQIDFAVLGRSTVRSFVYSRRFHSINLVFSSGFCILHLRQDNCENWFVRFSLDPSLRFVSCGNLHGRTYVWDVDGPAESDEDDEDDDEDDNDNDDDDDDDDDDDGDDDGGGGGNHNDEGNKEDSVRRRGSSSSSSTTKRTHGVATATAVLESVARSIKVSSGKSKKKGRSIASKKEDLGSKGYDISNEESDSASEMDVDRPSGAASSGGEREKRKGEEAREAKAGTKGKGEEKAKAKAKGLKGVRVTRSKKASGSGKSGKSTGTATAADGVAEVKNPYGDGSPLSTLTHPGW